MRTFEHRTYFEPRTYREMLKDPRWQKKRLKIFERDGWKCVYCGNEEDMLCVHHFYYEVDCKPWNYPDDALITLCKDCHNTESDKAPEQENLCMRTKRKQNIYCPHCDKAITLNLLEGDILSFYPLKRRGLFSSLKKGEGEGGGEGGEAPKKRQVRRIPKQKAETASKFTPPTPAEAEEYAKSIYFNLDGNAFCDHYEARGWRYGAGCKMRSWKAAVRTWKNRRKEFGKNGKGSPREPDALPIDKQHELYYGKHNKRRK